MKKNVMMRIASVLLVAVLLSTCAISSTFAKYVTKSTGSDTAQVAKFGVVVTIANNLDLFDFEYATSNSTVVNIDNSVAVTSGSTYNLVAPGTKSGNAATVTIKGTPEVAVNVKTEATLTLTNWTIDTNTDYCPVVFTVGGNTYAMGSTESTDTANKTYTTINKLISAVEAALEVNQNYGPNTCLDSTNDRTFSWEWAFEGEKDSSGNFTSFQNDTNDTKLGAIAANGTSIPTISITLTTTVTQID